MEDLPLILTHKGALTRHAWTRDDSAGMLQQYLLGPWDEAKEKQTWVNAVLQNPCQVYDLLFGSKKIHLIQAPSLSPWGGHHFSIYYPGAHPRHLDSLKSSAYKMILWEKQDSLPCLRPAFREPATSLDNWLWGWLSPSRETMCTSRYKTFAL